MFIIPYHVKMRLKKLAKVLGILCLVLLIAGIFLYFWLGRFVVYSRESGLYFDFDRSTTLLEGTGREITPTENTDPVKIVYDDGSSASANVGLQPIGGYYADADMLSDHMDEVRSQVEALAPGTAVMVDVKSIYGNFYYSTGIQGAGTSDSVDISAFNDLIHYMDRSGLYLIAKVPAFCDQVYALAHQSSGLPLSSGALWMDDNACYWLDPQSPTVLNYLTSIAAELSDLGFDEVVFSHFYIPDSDNIVYDYGDSTESDILKAAAENLLTAFLGKRLVISFASDDAAFPVPSATSRLFLTGIDAASVANIESQAVNLTDLTVQLVFVTDSRDTRYDSYNVLRSFTIAQS